MKNISLRSLRSVSKEQIAAFLFLGMLLFVYHNFFYPPVVEERRTNDSLYALGNAVATGNDIRIRDEVMRYLADDAHIRLAITYTAVESSREEDEGKPAITYDFTKPLFNSYLFNMVRSLTDLRFTAGVVDFAISPDWETAKATIASQGSAVGTSRFVGLERKVRFAYEAVCEVDVLLSSRRPVAKAINCRMYVPRPQTVQP